MADQPLDYERCTPDEREVVLERLLTQRNVLLDEAFRVILAAEALEDHRADGALSMADWLAYRCNVPVTPRASGCVQPPSSSTCRSSGRGSWPAR